MASIWDLFVRLGIDTKDFTTGVNGAVKTTTQASTSITGSLSKIGGAVVLGGLTVVTAAAAALGGALLTTIQPASDLAETVSKTGVVFGASAEKVMQFGNTANTALGLSKNAALTATSTFGNLFRSMQMSETASAGMSMGLVQLAGDLASFNNMSTIEVLEKLRAGITGETEPLKSLGINISAAAIEAEALALGLGKTGKELSASAKATASYSLIMKQTTLAQGDFARTSAGLANQQRILSATFENLKTTIGAALLPLVTRIYAKFNEWLSSPALQSGVESFIAGLSRFADILSNVFFVIANGGNIFGALIDTFDGQLPDGVLDGLLFLADAWDFLVKQLTTNKALIVGILAAIGVAIGAWAVSTVTAMAPVIVAMAPVLAIMAAVGAAAYLLYTAWSENWGGIQQVVGVAVTWLQGILGAFFEGIGKFVGGIVDYLSGQGITGFSDFFYALANGFLSIGGGVGIFQSIGDALFVVGDVVGAVTTWIGETVSLFLANMQAWWAINGDSIMLGVQSAWSTIQNTVASIAAGIQAGVGTFLETLQAWWVANGATITANVTTVWNAIQSLISTVTSAISSVFAAFKSAFEGDWYSFGANLRKAWDTIWNGIKEFVGDIFPAILGIVTTGVNSVVSAFQSVDWGGVGNNIISGIAAGINSAISWIVDAAKKAAQAALDAAKGLLGIQSPSKVFMEIGVNTMKGMAIGINEASNIPEKAVERSVSNVSSRAFNVTVNPHYYRGDEPSLLQELTMLNSMLGA